jgi:hypothetical protein
MKRFFQILFIASLFLVMSPLASKAQCKGFAKKICKLELLPYIHDGNYHAAILVEGEEAELYKTFYSGQDYRIAVCGSDAFPDVEFRIIDQNRNVLYDNKENGLTRIWDFKLESSQQLKIIVKVPVNEENTDEVVSGCVAIMFGFKEQPEG